MHTDFYHFLSGRLSLRLGRDSNRPPCGSWQTCSAAAAAWLNGHRFNSPQQGCGHTGDHCSLWKTKRCQMRLYSHDVKFKSSIRVFCTAHLKTSHFYLHFRKVSAQSAHVLPLHHFPFFILELLESLSQNWTNPGVWCLWSLNSTFSSDLLSFLYVLRGSTRYFLLHHRKL